MPMMRLKARPLHHPADGPLPRAGEDTHVPARRVLGSAVALWLCYFVLITARAVVVEMGDFGDLLWRRALVTLAGIVVTMVAWPLLRHFDGRPLAVRLGAALVIMLPAALVLGMVNQQAFAPVEARMAAHMTDMTDDKMQPAEPEGLWRQLTDVTLGRYFLLIAWSALYLALGNAEIARAAERREGEYRRAAKAAELRSLRYQVNPHFLFNTLNSLSALVLTGRGEAAERMIQTMSSFYRHSLAADPTADVPLADEIALQRHYLEIEAVRFPERLKTAFDVPPDLAGARVPGMILQPLVENSIKYAVAASTRAVTIAITAEAEGRHLVLTVSDDGPGKTGKESGTGIGLANVGSRLAARFGPGAMLSSGPRPGGGYATTLVIPLDPGGMS
jgi:two-component system, LytTR family, sensor kinase